MPRGKKYHEALKLIDPKKSYSPAEAVELVKKIAKTKFDASVEVHFRLGIDTEKGEQQVRGVLVFPHGTGKSKKVAVFAEAGKEEEAKKAGADLVGGEELIAEIAQNNKCNFDVAVATPAMMPKLAKIAKILGPKGLMPNPKNETVTNDLTKAVGEIKKGKIIFRNDTNGNMHAVIGKVSFDNAKLLDNLHVLLEAVKRAKPPTSKGVYLQNVTLNATMGPSIKLAV